MPLLLFAVSCSWAAGDRAAAALGRRPRAGREQLPARLGGYFRYGNSARHFDKIQTYALARLALFVAKRHKKRSYGWLMAAYESPNRMGLINLNGRVIAPRPNRPWRAKPNAGGEGRR